MVAKLLRERLPGLGIWVSVSVSIAVVDSAYAGIDAWTPTSLHGGVIQAVAVDPSTPNTIYVGTAGSGVFRSDDGGATWQAARSGIDRLDVQALAIDPVDPNNVYAGSTTQGVFRSRDGGTTWTAINTGLKNLNVYTLAVHPQDPARLYAGTFGNLFQTVNADAASGDEVTWQTVGVPTSTQQTNLINNTVYSVTLSPANPDTLFVGTHTGGVFRRQGGAWSQVWSDPRANPTTTISNVRNVAVSNDGSLLYAATQGLGIYTSGTSGNSGTWSATAGTGLGSTVLRSFVMDPTDPAHLYAGTVQGFFYSTNGATAWTESGTELNTLSIAVDPATPATVYAGTAQGLFKSTDGGASFIPASNGITNFTVVALAADPNDPSVKYAATADSGVLRSTDGGASWSTFNDGLDELQTTAIAVDANSSPTSLFVGTANQGLFRFPALDGTAAWERLSDELATRKISALIADPTRSGTLYAGTSSAGVLTTGNGGLSWSANNDGIANESSETCITEPLDACFHTNLEVDALGIDPSNPSVVYAALSGRGVFKSSDAGATWMTISNGLTNTFVTAIGVDPSDGSRVYVGTQVGVFRSADGGGLWELASNGLAEAKIVALVIDPTVPETLYAGTADAGVFKSSDRGDTWTSINTDLANLNVRSLSLDASTSPATLLAGVEGDGVLTIQSTVSSGAAAPAATTMDAGSDEGGGALAWWCLWVMAGALAIRFRSAQNPTTV